MLTKHAETTLRAKLGSDLLLAGMPGFDAARTMWNAMIDRYPAAIAVCRNLQNVQAALHAARESGLAVSVKGGGHNIGGTAVADGALMIDLSTMRSVEVDPTARLAHVQGGATLAELDAATQAHSLATPGGVVSSTGVAGLTLGGGFGWLSRQFGLAVDNLVAVKLVLADGQIVDASETEHADLFWAIRGGSGNFGVATRFTFRLHDLGPSVLFGPTFFALSDAKRVLTAYAEHAPQLPGAACVWANLMTAPPAPVLPEAVHGTKVLTLMQFFDGDPETGRAHLAKLYGGCAPLGSALDQRPFVEAQQFLDPTYDHGARNYWRAHNHTDLSPALIDTLLDLAPDLPTPASELLICQLGGAIADRDPGSTAFPHRHVPFVSTPGVRWTDPNRDAEVIDWLKAASARISEHAVPGAYVNFIAEIEDAAQKAYGANLDRLATVKRRYDPTNLFRANQNIAPQPA